MTARRLLLSATALELLRRRVLVGAQRLPPGFGLQPTATQDAQQQAFATAAEELRAAGAMTAANVHPAVVTDLQVLALPELAVTIRAARPGLEVTAVVAVRGQFGASLLRTADDAVQLSTFSAHDVAAELTRLVPTPRRRTPAGQTVTVPLDALAADDPRTPRLRATRDGALRAQVVAGSREGRPAALVGSVDWVHTAAGWTGLEALPSVAGRPQVRLVPVEPADLAVWLAPLMGRALA